MSCALHRQSPYDIPGFFSLKNRVVVPPMASQTADEAGFVSDKTLAHYKNLSQSGAALIWVEYSFIHRSGRSEKNQLGVDHDDKIPGLQKLARLLQAQNMKVGLQMVHAGGKSDPELTGETLWGASAIPVPVKAATLPTPREISLQEIQILKQHYVAAARRASLAGFDAVELHAAHGYGLNQWLSSLTNQRQDFYGGSLERRARLLFEIVDEVRAQFPSLLLAVRLPGQDHMPEGLSIDDSLWIARELRRRGVQLLDISSGIGGWRRPGGREGEGYLVPDAAKVRQFTGGPVIAVGGIESGEYIDESLKACSFDFAAVGRAILKDPKAWGRKVLGVEV